MVLGVLSLSCDLKAQKFFSLIILFSILIITGLSYGLPDELVYKSYFYNSLNFSLNNAFDYNYAVSNGIGRDSGYMLLAYVFREFEFNFIEFKFCLYFIFFSYCMFLHASKLILL